MHGAKRNVALVLAVASLFCWCQSSAESCVELSEAIGALDSGALVELGEHIGAEPSKFAAAIAQAKPGSDAQAKSLFAKLRSVFSQLNTSSPASKWLGAFNSTAVDEVPGDDGVRNVNGELYSETGGWQDLKKSESSVKGCATMQTNSSEKMGWYVDKHCEHDSDTKYIGGHQYYTNKLNTHLGEEVEDKLREEEQAKEEPPKEGSKGPPEKVEKDGQTWTKCRTAVNGWFTKKSVSCKHGLYKNRCLPDKGYVFQMRVRRILTSCTSCKPGYVFVMVRHKARTGECRKYWFTPQIVCTKLHTNERAGPEAQATLCTKVAEDHAGFKLKTLKDEEAKKHFAKAAGQWGVVRTICDLRKETVCVNGNCDVKKQAVCSTVCKYADRHNGDLIKKDFGRRIVNATFRRDNCFPDLCKGKYGQLACTASATMG